MRGLTCVRVRAAGSGPKAACSAVACGRAQAGADAAASRWPGSAPAPPLPLAANTHYSVNNDMHAVKLASKPDSVSSVLSFI